MSFDGDTVTHPYIDQPGPIHLRRDPVRRDMRRHDLRAAEGILLAVTIGAAGLVWGLVFAMWMLR